MTDLFVQLENGAVAIVGTRRLRRYLFEQYSAYMSNRGENAWETPQILTWDDWVENEWNRVAWTDQDECRHVLDDQQELQLWSKVISSLAEARGESGLVQSSATSKAARDTWRLIQEWRLDKFRLANTLIEDTQVFYEWMTEFVRLKDRQHWLSASELCAELSNKVTDGKWACDRRLLFLGFSNWLPVQRFFIEQLEAAGVDLSIVEADRLDGDTVVIQCLDRRSEFVAAANWARNILLSESNASIGVIVDDLVLWRAEVELVFDQVLHPKDSLSHDTDRIREFHVSMGNPLGLYPVIEAALMLLDTMRPTMTTTEATYLLHSPFTRGGLSESPLRARIDQRLRRLGWEKISLGSLRKQAQDSRADMLFECLEALSALKHPRSQSPAGWSATFIDCLSAFGWPGDRPLNSSEYQTVEAWRELISRFARLNVVLPELNLDQALMKLRQMVLERIFQPQAPPAAVQIMGIEESSGLVFDHLWISGMSDEDWPPALRPNPFLPYALQRELGLPGAVAERELTRYREITDRLLGAASNTVVSFPRQRQEQALNLSPVYHLESMAEWTPTEDTIIGLHRRYAPRLEALLDNQGPSLGDEIMHGGARIFSDQAACPFRAFASHRLDASGLHDAVPGLDPAQRGNLVHVCLAGVWGEIKSHQELIGLSSQSLTTILQRHIDKAVSVQMEQDASEFRKEVLEIERVRILALLEEWMVLERDRPSFSVLQTEHRVDTELSGIPLRLRIDRIDQVDGDYMVIIDYKTGNSVRAEDWLGERPDDSQLPLYLVTLPGEVGGLAFAQVRKGQNFFKGLSKTPAIAKGVEVRDDWTELESRWRRVLEGLAEEFKAGSAAVLPKAPSVCKFCDVKPLCRVFEVTRGSVH